MFYALPGPSSRTCAALAIRIQARIVLEHLFPFAEVGNVFGNVPARFSSISPKLPQQIEANRVPFIDRRVLSSPAHARIEVFPAHFERHEPGEMVNTRAAKAHALIGHIRVVSQFIRSKHDRMAESAYLQRGCTQGG